MNRRNVLRVVLLSAAFLSSLTRKALSGPLPEATTAPNEPPHIAPGGTSGLPSDWRFISPHRWNTVDESLSARLKASPLRDASPIQLGGIRIARASGTIELGSLDPTGEPVELPASLAEIVQPADKALSLEVLNRDFNPFLSKPLGADGQPLVGPFQEPSELYQGKALIPVRLIMTELFKSAGQPGEAMQPLLGALREVVVIRTPAHQFRLADGIGNRIVFYGNELDNGKSSKIGHTHIDELVTTLSQQNLRLIKQMVHFDGPAQGGTPEEIVGDGVGGSTHAGGFSAGYDKKGHPIAIRSDWPSSYGVLGDSDKTYGAHLLAVDYSAGAYDPIPEAALSAYYQNADMWDCAAAMLVPFADQDPDPNFRDYEYNPLEVFDQASARSVAAALAAFNRSKFLEKHGAFYCAEGQYVVANLGPQEDAQGGTLLKKSRYGETPFGRLIVNFAAAPGYAGMSSEEQRKHPFVGWTHLRSLGPAHGGISDFQFTTLNETMRLGVFLDWIPEDVQGWQAYRPKDAEALIARPMTVASMAWGLLRRYMPRDRVARAIMTEILRANRDGDDRVKQAVVVMAGGEAPESPGGQARLAGVAAKAATGLLLGLLASDQVRASLLYKAGYYEITNEVDKKKVQAAYDGFLTILQNADYSTQAALDRALLEADAKFAGLSVTRGFYNLVTEEREPAKSTVMKYAAPPCFGMWAQQPLFADTGCLRYVATAMHVSQMKNATL